MKVPKLGPNGKPLQQRGMRTTRKLGKLEGPEAVKKRPKKRGD